MTGSPYSTAGRRSRSSWSTTPPNSQPSGPKGNRVMAQQPATEQEYLIPDEIARAAVLPGSYTDEENTVFPAYAWLRANNPLGLAKLEGFDPIWLVTKHADIMAIERNPELFPAGVNNAILNDQPSDNFTPSLTGGTTRVMDAVPFMEPPVHTTYRCVVYRLFLPCPVKKNEPQIRNIALSRDY